MVPVSVTNRYKLQAAQNTRDRHYPHPRLRRWQVKHLRPNVSSTSQPIHWTLVRAVVPKGLDHGTLALHKAALVGPNVESEQQCNAPIPAVVYWWCESRSLSTVELGGLYEKDVILHPNDYIKPTNTHIYRSIQEQYKAKHTKYTAIQIFTNTGMWFSIQQGACPIKIEDNREHPFTAAPVYSPLVQRLHLKFGNLSRVDARLNTEDRKPYCNWFCRDQEFIDRAGRLPLYGANYFPVLYVLLKGWAHVGKEYMITSEDEVDELMQKTSPV
jgi:hypothetical protein